MIFLSVSLYMSILIRHQSGFIVCAFLFYPFERLPSHVNRYFRKRWRFKHIFYRRESQFVTFSSIQFVFFSFNLNTTNSSASSITLLLCWLARTNSAFNCLPFLLRQLQFLKISMVLYQVSFSLAQGNKTSEYYLLSGVP